MGCLPGQHGLRPAREFRRARPEPHVPGAHLGVYFSRVYRLCRLYLRANRHYHIAHPELGLENSTTVLVVWTNLVAGVMAAGYHFLDGHWSWSVPPAGPAVIFREFCVCLYLAAGLASLFVYLRPELEGFVLMLGIVISVWQGVLFWIAKPGVEQVEDD